MNWTETPRDEAGMPIGGIGAGKIEFCRNGRFTNVTTNNNLDAPIVDGVARTPLFPRIKEGAPGSVRENAIRRKSVNSVEGLPGGWMAVWTPRDGATLLKTAGRLAFTPIAQDRISYLGRYPLAEVDYRGFADLDLHLDAYSSFDPVDEREDYFNSSLPLGLFTFTVTNRGTEALPVSLAFSWQNLSGIGGYPLTMINEPDRTPPVFRADGDIRGLWFDHDPTSTADPRVLGNHSLCVASADLPAEITYHAGWNPAGEGHDVWDGFAATGKLGNISGPSTAGAVSASLVLAPGQRARVTFSVGWFMPHLLAAETKWDTLVRPSGAPPAPESNDRRDYGHAYQNWFADSWTVATHGLGQSAAIFERIRRWQGQLDRSTLPPLAVAGICNDLCALVSNTWYTRDGHYAVNEAPTDMNGCFGTIDQRSVGCGAVALSFAGLNRAELSLFAADQIREDGDPRRFGPHWNADGGHFDLPLDRAGAILHDIGWDHLEGGRTGDSAWPSLHWPEHTSHFVLQSCLYAQLSGDRAWLDERYPQMRQGLDFQLRLDQDGDGVPDLWGAGSFTYDTELYPHYGASAYATSLYLAALRAVIRLAGERGETDYAQELEQRFKRAQAVLEGELFDAERGYYTSWRDNTHAAWKGHRAHARTSSSSHISQLAGAWWADMLGLDPIVDPTRRRQALEFIGRHNVAAREGCPADEYQLDGTAMQSMSALAMGNYAAHAIGAGVPDHGWAAARNIYRARYEVDGCPWDATLQWSGPDNRSPQWGRWYMSHPASWFLLPALGGVRIDRLRGRLTLCPSWPAEWGDELSNLPVFLSGLELIVSARRSASGWRAEFVVGKISNPLKVSQLEILLPPGTTATGVTVSGAGRNVTTQFGPDGRAVADLILTLDQTGQRLAYELTTQPGQ
ncbi:MAG: GH116 family glycosyl-hydrolase [Devosia sp.]|nr:GH116 family glycosyl-hydrolase [Devosia sp.]